MTSIHTYPNPPTATTTAPGFTASTRPIPRASVYRRRMWRGRFVPAWATTVEGAKITATVVTLLALVALLVVPPVVTTPILVVLVTALTVGGLFRMVAQLTRPVPAEDPDTRRDA